MQLKYSSCQFIFIYTIEAHAQDRWRLDGSVQVNEPKTNIERSEIVHQFIQRTNWPIQEIPIWMDNVELDNPFEKAYACWPLRFYIIKNYNQITYIAQPHQGSFNLKDLTDNIYN